MLNINKNFYAIPNRMRFIVIFLAIISCLVTLPSQAKQPSCKAKNFTEFFKKFTNNIEMQQLCTQFPLHKLELVEQGDDLTPQIHKIPSDQIKYPLILSLKSMEKEKLKYSSNNSKPSPISTDTDTVTNTVTVRVYKPDSGYRVLYYFVKNKDTNKTKNNAWKLIKIEDWSI